MLRYYLLVASVNSFFPQSPHYVNHRDLNEDRRARLREIELKAVQYQDELECGQRTLKSGWSIQQQVEHYRRKLLRKVSCRNLTFELCEH
jgi:U2-associated protein SR140